jgi:hypothetical protein
MKISIYTSIKNGIYFDFHAIDMLKHHLDFADEIIVNEGYSEDKTYEMIKDIHPKIKIHRNEWDNSDPKTWSVKMKEQSRQHCTGDWCILLDCDEFIPEWEFGNIRERLEKTKADILSVTYYNFYGNYKVLNREPQKFMWPLEKYIIHRNIEGLEIWGDGSNIRKIGHTDYSVSEIYEQSGVILHHFGFVRNAARLREKWRIQGLRNNKGVWNKIPGFIFNLFPLRWDDPHFLDSLSIYDGPYIRAVRLKPMEFVRDNFQLHELLTRNQNCKNVKTNDIK